MAILSHERVARYELSVQKTQVMVYLFRIRDSPQKPCCESFCVGVCYLRTQGFIVCAEDVSSTGHPSTTKPSLTRPHIARAAPYPPPLPCPKPNPNTPPTTTATPWHGSALSFHRERSFSRPLVFFGSDWCVLCRQPLFSVGGICDIRDPTPERWSKRWSRYKPLFSERLSQ